MSRDESRRRLAPLWRSYDVDELARVKVPEAAANALAARGLPDNAYEYFVRVPERELKVTELPMCGRAAFLGQHEDGWNNTYWLSLTDGSVWMRYGGRDEPVDHVKRINSSVPALQNMLDVYCAFEADELEAEDDLQAHADLVCRTVLHAVSTEPELFADSENWWPRTFEEIGYSAPGILRGDKVLYEYVQRDRSGRWELNHPGYEEDDDELSSRRPGR